MEGYKKSRLPGILVIWQAGPSDGSLPVQQHTNAPTAAKL